MYYVKAVYMPSHMRLPDISKHKTDDEAAIYISTCLKWRIGILSCEIVSKETAENLLQNGKAKTMEDLC